MIGSRSTFAVRIQDEEDITRVQFNQSVYRPGTQQDADSVTLHVDRTVRFAIRFKIFVSSLDGSAKKTRTMS